MQKTSIIFTGDIGFDNYMAGRFTGENILSPAILDFLHSGDHVVANVEGALVDPEKAKDDSGKGTFFHTMDPAVTCFLQKIRADIWNQANNHCMDAGRMGIESTLAIARELGVQTFGAGLNIEEASRPIYLNEAGGIGMIGVGYMPKCVRSTETEPGSFGCDETERIRARIQEIKKTCRWCVVVAHNGEEFTAMPAPCTRRIYHEYLEMGADVVVAHHPHVPMNYETVGDKLIFYSLGNFIFDTNYQRAERYTDNGILVKLNFTEEKVDFEALGMQLLRGPERLVETGLPQIFEDIQAEEYEKLIGVASEIFIHTEKRRKTTSNPKKFWKYTDAQWKEYFLDPKSSATTPDWHMDLAACYELAEKSDMELFQSSKLDGVKRFILSLI